MCQVGEMDREVLVMNGSQPCEAVCDGCGSTLRPGDGLLVTQKKLTMTCAICGYVKKLLRVELFE